jgi:hypothetical protein
MPSGKQATLIVWFVGLSVLIGLTVWYGADHVGEAMLSVGLPGFALVVLARATAVAMAGAGWWLLFPRHGRRWRAGIFTAPAAGQSATRMNGPDRP